MKNITSRLDSFDMIWNSAFYLMGDKRGAKVPKVHKCADVNIPNLERITSLGTGDVPAVYLWLDH